METWEGFEQVGVQMLCVSLLVGWRTISSESLWARTSVFGFEQWIYYLHPFPWHSALLSGLDVSWQLGVFCHGRLGLVPLQHYCCSVSRVAVHGSDPVPTTLWI